MAVILVYDLVKWHVYQVCSVLAINEMSLRMHLVHFLLFIIFLLLNLELIGAGRKLSW